MKGGGNVYIWRHLTEGYLGWGARTGRTEARIASENDVKEMEQEGAESIPYDAESIQVLEGLDRKSVV